MMWNKAKKIKTNQLPIIVVLSIGALDLFPLLNSRNTKSNAKKEKKVETLFDISISKFNERR